MKPDGSLVSPLSEISFNVWNVSPDGTELIGYVWNDREERGGVAVLPTTGGAPRLLESVFPLAEHFFSFTPDGAWVTYMRQQNGQWNVYGRPRGGGPERQITRFADNMQIFATAWSRDGRLAVSRGTGMSDVVLITSK